MRVLVLAYIYPPDSGSGTFRSLYFFNRIAQAGDEVCVLTACEKDYAVGTPVDEALRASIDPGIKVLRARVARPVDMLLRMRSALRRGSGGGPAAPHQVHDAAPSSNRKSRLQEIKDLITDLLTFPDHQIGWLPYAYRLAGRQIRASQPDCIYSSGGPWTSHLVAVLLKKRHRCAVVLDFRDPWAVNPDIAHRSGLFRRLSRRVEAFCVRNADHVVLNTPQLREDFAQRYPGEKSTKFMTVTNGFEDHAVPARKPSGRFTLVHAGEIYLSRNPASFLRAIQQLIRTKAIPMETLQVQLVGGCARNPEIDALLDSAELREVIRLVPRVSHREALEYQANADVLVLFQMAFPLQVPRKLFEYMSMSKPVLAITERTGATASAVRDSGVGAVAEPEADSIASALLSLYEAWRSGGTGTAESEKIGRYRNSRLAMELRGILHSAAQLPKPLVARPGSTDVN